jgi:hypothetical protein
MEHPLLPSLDELTSEELSEKLSELNRKLTIAYRMGNHDLCNQIRMAVESYQNKLTEKNRKAQGGEDFGNIIDIS